MKISKPFYVFLLLVMCILCSHQFVKAEAPDIHFAEGKFSASMPFEDDFGLIFLKVQVNGSKPLWFLLDTGFDTNILNADLVKPLNIELKDKQVVAQPGGSVEMGSAAGLKFNLGGVELS